MTSKRPLKPINWKRYQRKTIPGAARALLKLWEDPRRWCKDHYYKDGEGDATIAEDATACCLEGGLDEIYEGPFWDIDRAADEAAASLYGVESAAKVNDRRGLRAAKRILRHLAKGK